MKYCNTIEKLIRILNNRAEFVILEKETGDAYSMTKKGQSTFEFHDLERLLKLAVEGLELNWYCILCFAKGEQTQETLSEYGYGDFVVAENDSSQFIIRITDREFLREIKGLKLNPTCCPDNQLLSNTFKN